MNDEDIEGEYRGYEVTVFIPEEAPDGTREIVFETVLAAVDALDDEYTGIRDRDDWDFAVEGSPADHKTAASLIRAIGHIQELRTEVRIQTTNHAIDLQELGEVHDREMQQALMYNSGLRGELDALRMEVYEWKVENGLL